MKRTLFVVIMLSVTLLSCSHKEKAKVLKLAHGLDPSHPVHKAMVYMADRCNELSGGKLQIQIYPSGQLGSEQQCVELLQIGSLAITKVSAAVMESFVEEYKVLGLPYIFKSKEHAFKVLDGEIGKELLADPEPYLIRGLCFYDAGSRSFYTIKTPIYKPDDLKGLKIRVMKSMISMELVKALGGSPTPISFGELYTALQSGVVDGAENNPPSFYTSHHYEVCKYYSLNEHSMVPDVLIISLKVWKSLTDQERKWLQQAANESVGIERELWAKSVQQSLAAVEKAGVTIIHPDKKPFAEKVEGMYEMFRDQPRVYNLLNRIRNTD
ncbi:MAG TPA: TRAP transporter substrate-binding protein [Bacteroidales bacterium]|nr:TRAP transporter substrate-binding protein [Bacteroidales bacterium]